MSDLERRELEDRINRAIEITTNLIEVYGHRIPFGAKDEIDSIRDILEGKA